MSASLSFFIFLVFMSFVSFAVAFIGYAAVVWLLGTGTTASRYTQMIAIPLLIVAFDFAVITAPPQYQYIIGGIPIGIIGFMVLYMRFIKGEPLGQQTIPEPLTPHKPSAKSLKHAEKKRKRQQRLGRE